MRSLKSGWLVLLLASFLVACGGDDDEPGVCGNGVVEKGEQCDDGNTSNDDGCSSTCQLEPGWSCDENGDCERVEICDNGIDDTGNGLVDCQDPTCDTHAACVTECSTQASCASGGGGDRAVWVCAEGVCRNATSYGTDGEVLYGEVGIVNQYDQRRTKVSTLRSYSVQIFHPSIPGSQDRLTCDQLTTWAREANLDASKLNVMKATSNQFVQTNDRQNDLIRVADVPATGDENWLVLTRFFTGGLHIDSKEPTGQMPALSCIENFSNPPGEWDPSRQVQVDVEAACRSDADCADGWTCQTSVGLCAYLRCDPTCSAGEVCRELPNGEPACMIRCEAGDPPCPVGNRCDTTPGWRPACFPD